MSGKELIDIASEQSREWMEIWGLFVVVLMGMLGGMLTMGNLENRPHYLLVDQKHWPAPGS